MPRVAIILETPALVRQGLPILTAASYDIQRDLNAAGQFVIEFPAAEELADLVKTRWRVSVVEEGRPGYLLRRAIVTVRDFNIDRAGQGTLRLAGYTRLYGVARLSTHIGLSYDGTQAILDIAEDLTGETVAAPSVDGIADMKPEVEFSDTTKLAGLLSALEYERLNIRETFDEDSYELVSRDDVPNSGYRFVTVERAGPELQTAAARGMGLIAGSPKIGWSGQDVANRIIPIGVDHDGEPLTLEHATLSDPYPVLSDLNPDGSTFWYIEDTAAIDASELIEAHYVRSDIKNPNDDPTSRAKAADCLYALAVGRLLTTKSDTLAFSSEIANGARVDALPGDRVIVQYRGRARSFAGGSSHWNLDRDMLVVKRRDASTAGGVRGVSFTLTAPEVPLAIPSLPGAFPIPPPPRDPPDPPDPFNDPGGDEADTDPALEDLPEAPAGPLVPPGLVNPAAPPTGYHPCCADPNRNLGGGTTPPPFDITNGYPVRHCTARFIAAATQDNRFVTHWGYSAASPDATQGWTDLDPARDVIILTLASSSGDPVGMVSGGTIEPLAAIDSSSPANFGGDGHTWWRAYLIKPTANLIDLTGTTGAFRHITFFKANQDLPIGGTALMGIDATPTLDLQYSGSHFGFAEETASAGGNARFGDAYFYWVDSVYRSIDDITFDKTFNAPASNGFNHDFSRHNSEFIPLDPGGGAQSGIDWLLDDKDDLFLPHSVSASFHAAATASDFPGACRILAFNLAVRLEPRCAVHLIA